MSTGEFPDEQWTEDQLLQLVQDVSEGASGPNAFLLLPALEQLSQRKIRSEVNATKILLETARTRGSSNPEARLLSMSLSALCNSNDECLKMLGEELRTSAGNERFLHCTFLVISGLVFGHVPEFVPFDSEKGHELIRALLQSSIDALRPSRGT